MLVSIHQPHYLPWLRYVDKLARSECFLLLDDVQYCRGGWQNRQYVKTAFGRQLLTVPVHERFGGRVCDVRIAGDSWRRKHWQTLLQSYGRSEFWDPSLEVFFNVAADSLSAFSAAMLSHLLEQLAVQVPVLCTSRLDVRSTATQRLIDLVKAVDGTAYLTGAHALQEYLDPTRFKDQKIALYLYEWTCPRYAQRHGEFIPDLATLDLLLSEGPERAREVLSEGGRVRRYEL